MANNPAPNVPEVPPTRPQMLGHAGERLALEHYERLGFTILARNHRTQAGELDLIVRDADHIVFVEVKTCRDGEMDPFEAITRVKRQRLRRLAAAWLQTHPPCPQVREIRFDAVGVITDRRGRLITLEQREAVL